MRKLLSGALAAILFTTQAFAYNRSVFSAPAQDIWSERAKHLNPPTASVKKAVQNKTYPLLNSLLNSVSPYLSVRTVHKGQNNQPTILLLQDVHMNTAAQKNIGRGLEEINKRSGSEKWVIGVEAAHGTFDFGPYRRFSTTEVNQAAADLLLKENKIAAASWLGLSTEKLTVPIIGAETPRLYKQNVSAFKKVAAQRKDFQETVGKELAALKKEAHATLSEKAQKLFSTIEQYHNGTTPIIEHVSALGKFSSLKRHPNLERLVAAVAQEKALNTTAAKQERDRLFQKLQLNEAQNLGDLDLKEYPHLQAYLAYMKNVDALNQDQVFSEIRMLTNDAIAAFSRSSQEKTIFERLTALHLQDKLVRFELTPEEWAEYKTSHANRACACENFESFYQLAEERNNAMLENLDSAMKKNKSTQAVLVAGGFHTPGIAHLLEKRGASYVVLRPHFTADSSNENHYLNEFLRERTPLAKLFSGEKLTMALATQNLGAQAIDKTMASGEARQRLTEVKLAIAASDGTLSKEEERDLEETAGMEIEVYVKGHKGRISVDNYEIEIEKTYKQGDDTFEIPTYGRFKIKQSSKIPSHILGIVKNWKPNKFWLLLPVLVGVGIIFQNWAAVSLGAGALAMVLATPGQAPEEPIKRNFRYLEGVLESLPEDSPLTKAPKALGPGWAFSRSFALDPEIHFVEYENETGVTYVLWEVNKEGHFPRINLYEDDEQKLYISKSMFELGNDWARQRHFELLYNSLSAIERISFDYAAEREPHIQDPEKHRQQEEMRARHSLRVADAVVADISETNPALTADFKEGPGQVRLSDRLDLYILLARMRGTIPPSRPKFQEPSHPIVPFGLVVDPKKSGVESALFRQLVGQPDFSLKVVVGVTPAALFATLHDSRYGRFSPRDRFDYGDPVLKEDESGKEILQPGWIWINNGFIWVVKNAADLPPEEWQRLGVLTFLSTHGEGLPQIKAGLVEAVFGPDTQNDLNLIGIQHLPLRGQPSTIGRLVEQISKADPTPIQKKSLFTLAASPVFTIRKLLDALAAKSLKNLFQQAPVQRIDANLSIPVPRKASVLDASGRDAAGLTNQLPLDLNIFHESLRDIGLPIGHVTAETAPIEMGAGITVHVTFERDKFFRAFNNHLSSNDRKKYSDRELANEYSKILTNKVFPALPQSEVLPVYDVTGNAYVRGDPRLHLDVKATFVSVGEKTVSVSLRYFHDVDWQNARYLLQGLQELTKTLPLYLQDKIAPQDPRESDFSFATRLASARRAIPPHPLSLPKKIDLTEKPLSLGILGPSGRIGHLLVRLLVGELNLRLRAVSGPKLSSELVTAIRRDAAHGPALSNGQEINISVQKGPEGTLGTVLINDSAHDVLERKNAPHQINWGAYEIDLAVDPSGAFTDPLNPASLAGHTRQARGPQDKTGAHMALLTAPFKVDKAKGGKAPEGATHVWGVSPVERLAALFRKIGGTLIASAASCTTNALVVAIKALNTIWKDTDFQEDLMKVVKERLSTELPGGLFSVLQSGSTMLTVHAATNSQNTEDIMDKVDAKNRGMINAIGLTETGASSAIKEVGVEGDWANQIRALSARTHADTGSVIILTAGFNLLIGDEWPEELKKSLSGKKKELEAAFQQLVLNYFRKLSKISPFNEILAIAEPDEAFTSRHVRSYEATAILDAKHLQVEFDPDTGRFNFFIQVWYDNEIGYTHQVRRLLNLINVLYNKEKQHRQIAQRRALEGAIDDYTPVVQAVTQKLGAYNNSSEPLRIGIKVDRDGVWVRQLVSDVEAAYNGLRYQSQELLEAPLDTYFGIPLLSLGVTETIVEIPAGQKIGPLLTAALEGEELNAKMTTTDWHATISKLDGLKAKSVLALTLTRVQNDPSATFESLPSFLANDYYGGIVYAALSKDQFISFMQFFLKTIPSGRLFEGFEIETIELAQRRVLERLEQKPLSEAERKALFDLNKKLFEHLAKAAAVDARIAETATLAILRNFVVGDKTGNGYSPEIWGPEDSPAWQAVQASLEKLGLSQHVVDQWNGGVSFVPVTGLNIWERFLTYQFNLVAQNLGKTENVYTRESAGQSLWEIWQAVDSSNDSTLKKSFYRAAMASMKHQQNLGAYLEFTTDRPDSLGRVLAVFSLIFEMTHWYFIDKNLPESFVVFLFRKASGYSTIKFKRLFAISYLRHVPTILGLPRDVGMRQLALSGSNFTKENLFTAQVGIDGAIDRQINHLGIDEAALELTAARLQWWRTGDPSQAILACERFAKEITGQWRQTVTKGEPRIVVKRLFEELAKINGLNPDEVKISILASTSDGTLREIQEQLQTELPEQSDDIGRILQIEVPFYKDVLARVEASHDDEDINRLRNLSNTGEGILINGDSILEPHLYPRALDWLVHRELHRATGAQSIDFVRARLHARRTGDVVPMKELAKTFAPEQTESWRKETPDKIEPSPVVGSLFRYVAEMKDVSEDQLPVEGLADLSWGEQLSLKEKLVAELPEQEGAINHLFAIELRLYQSLVRRYNPSNTGSKAMAIRAAAKDLVDSASLEIVLDDAQKVRTRLANLLIVRRQLFPFLMGDPTADKFESPSTADDLDLYMDPAEAAWRAKPGYKESHQLYDRPKQEIKDRHYRAYRLDLLLRPIEEKLLEMASQKISRVKPEAFVHSASRLLAAVIELLDLTGWGNQSLRNFHQLLSMPNIKPARLALISDRILQLTNSFGYWRDRQLGEIIDSWVSDISFEELSPSLKSSLGITDNESLEASRLRLRPHVQNDFARRNAPLAYVKESARRILDRIEDTPEKFPPTTALAAEPDAVSFFPEETFGEHINESIAVQSEKGANLIRLGRLHDKKTGLTVKVPLGVIYPIGMEYDVIWERVKGDLEKMIKVINEQGLNNQLGSDFGIDAKDPILFSIRSGAIFDAPGQQHTVTNWGVSEYNIDALAARIGEWGAWDSLRRYYQEYGMAVHNIERDEFRELMEEAKVSTGKERKEEFTPDEMKGLALRYRQKIIDMKGHIPASLEEQLGSIIEGIQASWDSYAMRTYRESTGMQKEEGTAIIIQVMVKGNAEVDENSEEKISGAGAVFSGQWPWEPITGSFAVNTEGSDIADGVIVPGLIDDFRTTKKALWDQINRTEQMIHEHYGTKIQLEVTVQNDDFNVLQVRSVPEEPVAAIFEAAAARKAELLADGYSLSGTAVKGPVLSMDILKDIFTSNKISNLKDLIEVAKQDPNVNIILEAVRIVDYMRREEHANAEQIGIIIVSNEMVPEDLRHLRRLNELWNEKMVVGAFSNKGGPGAHEQENAIHLGLTTMGGTPAGEEPSQISFDWDNHRILFKHGQRTKEPVQEGSGVVSLLSKGKFMRVLRGNLPFKHMNGPSSRSGFTLLELSAVTVLSGLMAVGLLTVPVVVGAVITAVTAIFAAMMFTRSKKKAQPTASLPTADLANWRQIRPSLIDEEIADVIANKSVQHYSLQDFIDGSSMFNDGLGGATLRAKLMEISRIVNNPSAKQDSILLTTGKMDARTATTKLNELFEQYRIEPISKRKLMSGVIAFDHQEKADPFLAAQKYKRQIGGRTLHAFPMKLGPALNWDLDAKMISELNPDAIRNILIDIVELATGRQLRLENLPEVARQVLSAA